MTYSDALVEAVVARCNDAESGARAVDHILTHYLLPEISAELLGLMARGEDFRKVDVSVDASGAFKLDIS